MEGLQARFLPRFMEVAAGRLRHARVLWGSEDAAQLARELHALAGEARMLDLDEIASLALAGEELARAWSNEPDGAAKAQCAANLDALVNAMAALAKGARPSVRARAS